MNVLPQLQLALGDPVTVLFTVLRVAAVCVSLLVLLRLFGGQQFGQLSTIDLVTLLLLSNVVQNAMIGPYDSTLGGILGAAALLVLYRVTTRIPGIRRKLKSQPVILVYQGDISEGKLRRGGISTGDSEEAARAHSVANLSDVETTVLEVNGAISIIPEADVTHRKLLKVDSRRKSLDLNPVTVADSSSANRAACRLRGRERPGTRVQKLFGAVLRRSPRPGFPD